MNQASGYGIDQIIGNILIKTSDTPNHAVVHFGGEGSNHAIHRKVLTFRDNTVVSRRTTSQRTYLFLLGASGSCLSGTQVTAEGNVVSSQNASLSLREQTLANCSVAMNQNWLQNTCTDNSTGGSCPPNNQYGGTLPFHDASSEDYHLAFGNASIDARGVVARSNEQYNDNAHRSQVSRIPNGNEDIGAFETCFQRCPNFECGTKSICGDLCTATTGCAAREVEFPMNRAIPYTGSTGAFTTLPESSFSHTFATSRTYRFTFDPGQFQVASPQVMRVEIRLYIDGIAKGTIYAPPAHTWPLYYDQSIFVSAGTRTVHFAARSQTISGVVTTYLVGTPARIGLSP